MRIITVNMCTKFIDRLKEKLQTGPVWIYEKHGNLSKQTKNEAVYSYKVTGIEQAPPNLSGTTYYYIQFELYLYHVIEYSRLPGELKWKLINSICGVEDKGRVEMSKSEFGAYKFTKSNKPLVSLLHNIESYINNEYSKLADMQSTVDDLLYGDLYKKRRTPIANP